MGIGEVKGIMARIASITCAYVTSYRIITICDCMHDRGCLIIHEYIKFLERKRIKRLSLSERKIHYLQLETPITPFF